MDLLIILAGAMLSIGGFALIVRRAGQIRDRALARLPRHHATGEKAGAAAE